MEITSFLRPDIKRIDLLVWQLVSRLKTHLSWFALPHDAGCLRVTLLHLHQIGACAGQGDFRLVRTCACVGANKLAVEVIYIYLIWCGGW